MGPIALIILLYLAFLLMVIWHEVGHLGTKITIKPFFPLPVGSNENCLSRYGGLILNLVSATIIFYWKPENIFWQMFGLANWAHFYIYCLWGSFNTEYKWPKKMWKYVVFDDIPNEFWWFFVPIGIFSFFWLGDYYLPIAVEIVRGILLI